MCVVCVVGVVTIFFLIFENYPNVEELKNQILIFKNILSGILDQYLHV